MDYKKLISSCKNKDRKAQKAFFMHFSGPVYGIIMRYMGDEFASKDVLQNVFMILYRSLPKFEYENEFKLRAWIKTISVRETLRQLKKNKIAWEVEEDIENHLNVADSYSVLESMRTEELLELLHQLPEGYRLVFNMYAMEGYTHKEIAEALGISESTSRSQLTRARKLLQNYAQKLSKNG